MPEPGLAPEPAVPPGQRELRLMQASGMHPDQMHEETQNEITLQQSAGMKEEDIQKYWGVNTPQSSTVSSLTAGHAAQLGSAPPAVAARIGSAVQQAVQADRDVRDASNVGGNPDERPDAVSQILGYGKAAMEYASAGWTYATAWPVGMVDQGPGALLTNVPSPHVDVTADVPKLPFLPADMTGRQQILGGPDQPKTLGPTVLGDAVSQILAGVIMQAGAADLALPAREAAMEAFRKGEIGDPQHFADAVVGRENVTPGMRAAIPSNADYQQAATQLLAQPGKLPDPTMARRVMSNMQRVWTETGYTPAEQLQLAATRPDLKEELVTQSITGEPVMPNFNAISKPEPKPLAPPPPPETAAAPNVTTAPLKAPPANPTYFASPDEAMGMLRKLEGSADNAVSLPQGTGHGGAIGRYQIMPATARGYGYDPAKLFDPAYNEMVARHIVTDLYNKYHGNREAIEIAYNSTPKRAAEYLAAGPGTRLEAVLDKSVRGGIRYVTVTSTKDEAFLLPETQKYLANGRRRMGEKETGEPVGPDDYTPPPKAEVPADVDVRNAENAEDTELQARAEARAEAQQEKITSGGISAQSTWEHATDDQILDEVGAATGIQDDTPVRGMSAYDRAISGIASRLQPAKAIDDLARNTIKGYDPEKEFSLLDAFRQAAHSDDRAKVAMGFNYANRERGGVVVRDGDVGVKVMPDTATARGAFQQALKDGGDPDGFMKWLVARRATALESGGKETPVNLLAAQAAMKSATLTAKYEKAGAIWDEFTKGARDYAQASGRYSAEQIAGMEKADLGTWVSFNRVMGKTTGVTRRGFAVGAPVKGLKGSTEGLIGDPLSNSLDNVNAMFKAADNNYAVGKLVSMAEANPDLAAALGVRKVRVPRNPNLDDVEREMKAFGIPEDQWEGSRDAIQTLMSERDKLADNEFAYYRNGQKEVWKSGWPELSDMIKGATPVQAGGIIKLGQSIAHGVSGAITANPAFAVTMFASHQLVQFLNHPGSPLPFATGLSGIAKLMGMDGMLEDVMANGGLGSSMRELDRDNHYDTMTQVLGETGWLDRVRNDVSDFKKSPTLAAATKTGATAVLTPYRMLRAINERLDLGNRVGLSEFGQGRGLSPLKAGAQAAEYGIDYTNRATSATVNMWASMVPFMRANLLYSEQGLKAIERNPAAYALSAAVAVSLPKMILYGLNTMQDNIPPGQPGYLPENEKYRNQPVWERLYYFITPSIDGQRLKLRMPDFAAYVFGAVPEAAMMAMNEHNPAGFKDMFTTFLHDFVPPFLPPAVQTPLEIQGNINLETWQPLVPSSSQGVAGQLRYITETSGMAKSLAKYLGPDNDGTPGPEIGVGKIPAMAAAEHIATTWGGPIGLQILSALGAPQGHPGAPMDFAKLPFASSFLLTHPEGGRALDDFYAEKGRYDQWAQAKTELRTEGRRGDTSNAGYSEEARKFAAEDARLRQASIAIGRMRDAIYGIDAEKNAPDDDKRQRTNQIIQQMIERAQASTEQMKAMQ